MSSVSKNDEGIKENCHTFIITSKNNPLKIAIPQFVQQPFRYTDKKFIEIQEFFYGTESTDFSHKIVSRSVPITINLSNYGELFDETGSKTNIAEVVYPALTDTALVGVSPDFELLSSTAFKLDGSKLDPIEIGTGCIQDIMISFHWAYQTIIFGTTLVPDTSLKDRMVDFKRPYTIRVKIYDLRV
jgi:hypothetical protein